ncbi:alpha/beta hydrolase domain-containing protein [Pigmentiphaga soli]|uniref:Alpha/beta hydrolase domain-containing protein n=1 Tax=Pigmentiphaga soli TaxID=1007095 RepID=A0ABP8HKG8_9BURK
MRYRFCLLALPAFLAACGGNDDGNAGAGTPETPPPAASAGVIDRFEIVSQVDAYGGATPPGAAGPYTLITGIVHGKLAPAHPDNAGIVDLENAPTGEDGLVSYSTDVVILRPKSAATARRALFYDVVNRGGRIGQSRYVGGGDLDDGAPPAADFPSLLGAGYTVVWSGWQGNIAQTGNGATGPVGTLLPVARNADGSPITGLSREEFVPDNAGGGTVMKLNYPPASLSDRSEVAFTARQTWLDSDGKQDYAAVSVPVTAWSYQVGEDGAVSVGFTPPSSVPRAGGAAEPADQGTIYQFVYRARDPKVMGIGFAAVRDLLSFLRYSEQDAQGTPNPLNDLKGAACVAASCPGHPDTNVDVVIGEGVSQSGRFLRDFLYRGFNKAGNGKRVFDGLVPIGTGARRTWINYRFAQPDRAAKQHEDHWAPGVDFPFTYDVRTDPVGGATDGLLKNCLATDTCPKVMQIDGSLEWWGARGSLVVTDGIGNDIGLPDNVRYYFVAANQHTGGAGVTTGIVTQPAAGSRCEFAPNPVGQVTVERSLIRALERWIATGATPPASRYPTVAAGTMALPDRAAVGFPDLSDIVVPSGANATPTPVSVAYSGLVNQLAVTDYGNAVPVVDLARTYTLLVPTVDDIGNDVAGIRLPEVEVPVATYGGWNFRRAGYAQGDLCALSGFALPLAVSPATKGAADPRPTLADLYTGRADYVGKFGAAADRLVDQGFLLEADSEALYKGRASQISPLLIPNP